MLPSSMLVAAIFLAIYLMPLTYTQQQRLEVTGDGLTLVGDRSSIVLPWNEITGVRFKRVMLLMPYLIISLLRKEPLAQFLDQNPSSFLSKWTNHVRVFRRYPWVLRWPLSVPKRMTTLPMLDWLERRYGGVIVIDVAAVNGRGRELERLLRANIKPPARCGAPDQVWTC